MMPTSPLAVLTCNMSYYMNDHLDSELLLTNHPHLSPLEAKHSGVKLNVLISALPLLVRLRDC